MTFNEIVQNISATISEEDVTNVDIGYITTAIVELQDMYNTAIAERDTWIKDYDVLNTSHTNILAANNKLILEKTAEVMKEEVKTEVEEVIDERKVADEDLEELAEEW